MFGSDYLVRDGEASNCSIKVCFSHTPPSTRRSSLTPSACIWEGNTITHLHSSCPSPRNPSRITFISFPRRPLSPLPIAALSRPRPCLTHPPTSHRPGARFACSILHSLGVTEQPLVTAHKHLLYIAKNASTKQPPGTSPDRPHREPPSAHRRLPTLRPFALSKTPSHDTTAVPRRLSSPPTTPWQETLRDCSHPRPAGDCGRALTGIHDA